MRPRTPPILVLVALALGLSTAGSWRHDRGNPSGQFVVAIDGRAGYIDRRGKLVITPQLEEAYDFNGGRAEVVVPGAGWAYVNHEGRLVWSAPQ